MNELILVAVGLSLAFTGITAFFSVYAYAKVVGMEKSTHKIVQQYVPLDEETMGPTGPDLVKKMQKAFYPEDEGHV